MWKIFKTIAALKLLQVQSNSSSKNCVLKSFENSSSSRRTDRWVHFQQKMCQTSSWHAVQLLHWNLHERLKTLRNNLAALRLSIGQPSSPRPLLVFITPHALDCNSRANKWVCRAAVSCHSCSSCMPYFTVTTLSLRARFGTG